MGSQSKQLIQSSRKLAGLHGLRAIAALAVVLFHLKHIAALTLPERLATFTDHFYLSVQLFFVLSAFSLFHSSRCSPSTVSGYFVKRFFRIAPLFYLAILFQVWRGGMPDVTILLSNLTFTFNFFPGHEASIPWAGWSVGVEMLFYIMLPVVLGLASKQKNVVLFLTAMFGLAVALTAFVWYIVATFAVGLRDYVFYSLFANLAPFSAGLLAYELFRQTESKGANLLGHIGLVGIFWALLSLAFLDPLGLHWRIPGLYFAFWSIPFAVLCIWQSLYPSAILETAPLQWLADRSFSLYLLHPLVITYAHPAFTYMHNEWGLEGIGLYAGSLVVTLAILFPLANVSFRLIELPGIALGRKLSSFRSLLKPSLSS